MAPQNGNPRLCFLTCVPTGPGILVGLSGRDVVIVGLLVSVLRFVRKLGKDVCFVAGLGGTGGISATRGGVTGGTYDGSAVSSPACFLVFALHSRSLRFFGRR